MRSNRLPLWAIDWSLGRVENPINRRATYSSNVEHHFLYTALQIVYRVFLEALSFSMRTLTSPILLESIHWSHRSEDYLVEATRMLQQGEFIGNTPTWRISLEVLSLTRINGFKISSSSYMKVFKIELSLRNMFSKHKFPTNRTRPPT